MSSNEIISSFYQQLIAESAENYLKDKNEKTKKTLDDSVFMLMHFEYLQKRVGDTSYNYEISEKDVNIKVHIEKSIFGDQEDNEYVIPLFESKPALEERMTNEELAEWVSNGNGLVVENLGLNTANVVKNSYGFLEVDAHEQVPETTVCKLFGAADFTIALKSIYRKWKESL